MPRQRFGRWLLDHGYTLDRYAQPIVAEMIYDVLDSGARPCGETVKTRAIKTKKR